MKKIKIIGSGIATMDIYCHMNRMYPGGNEYNIAYNAKLQGADSGFMGVFADDRVGQILEETLKEAGVDTSYSHHEHGSSGYALVDLKDGDRVFIDWNRKGVTDLYPFVFTEDEIQYIKNFDVACISWGARVNREKIKKLALAGVRICYDFYDNFSEEDIKEISPYISFGFFSCSHLTESETEEVLRKCVASGSAIAVGTRGSKPAVAFDGKRFYKQDICPVKPVDTMGAGDAYISAFLMNYLAAEADEPDVDGDKITISLQKAAQFAATVIVKDGALGVGYDVDPARLPEIINLQL